jgi:hypothetical protein
MRIVKLFGQFQEPLHSSVCGLNKIKKLYRLEEFLISWSRLCPGHYIQGLKQMNDRKSNNDSYNHQVTKKDVMVFYEFIGDR